jgi:hypothetical protein
MRQRPTMPLTRRDRDSEAPFWAGVIFIGLIMAVITAAFVYIGYALGRAVALWQ